jgi:hypothetical protein
VSLDALEPSLNLDFGLLLQALPPVPLEFRQQINHHARVVERHVTIRQMLNSLMPLTRHDDHIPGPRIIES